MRELLFVLLIAASLGMSLANSDRETHPQTLQDVLDTPISVDLKQAPAEKACDVFSRVIGADLDLDFESEERVTIVVDGISLRTALNALCESVGCGWRLIEGEPRVLRFYSLEKMLSDKRAMAEDKLISLDLNEAEASQVFKLASKILDVELNLVGFSEDTSVTLTRDRATVAEFLDDVCFAVPCHWELVGGDPPKLRIEALP